MPITLEEYRRRFPDRPDPIPLEYAGKWVAMTRDRRAIIASGDDPIAVREEAAEAGHPETILHYVIPYPCIGIGSGR